MLLQKNMLRRTGEKSGAEDSPARKSTRIPVAISVSISGKDAAGRSFKEVTRTAEIDRQGARILTVHELALGTSLSIENASLGQTALAKVVGYGERRSRHDPFQVDVELVELPELFETASIWGVRAREPKPELKPEGKEEAKDPPRPAASGAAPGLAAPPAQSADPDSIRADTTGRPGLATRSQAASGAPPVPARGHAPPASGPAAMDAVRLAGEEAVAGLQKARLELQASLESRAAEQQGKLAEMAASGVREVQRKSDALAQDFQGRLENTLREFQEQRTSVVAGQLQAVAADFEASAVQRLEQQAAVTVERLSEALKASGATLVDETGQRLAGLSRTSAESIARQAAEVTEECRNRLAEAISEKTRAIEESTRVALEALVQAGQTATEECRSRLAESFEQQTQAIEGNTRAALEALVQGGQTATEECRSRLAESFEQQTQAIEGNTRAAADSVRGAAEGALARLEETRQQAESSVGSVAAECHQRLAEVQAVLGAIEQRSKDLPAGFPAAEGSAGNPGTAERQDAQRTSEELRRVARDVVRHSSGQLEEQSSAIAVSARAELKAAAKELFEETRQQVAQVARDTVESVGREIQATSEDSRHRLIRAFEEQTQAAGQAAEALIGSVQAATERSAGDFEMVQQKAQATVKALNLTAETVGSQIENARRESKAEFEGLRRDADDVLGRSSRQIREQVHTAAEEFNKEIGAAEKSLAEQTRQELAGVRQAALESLTGEARAIGQASRDELRRVLEEFVSRSAEEVRTLDDEVLEVKYEHAKRQRATLERLRLEFIRLQRGALRRMAGLTRDLVTSVFEGLRSNVKLGLQAGLCLAAVATVVVTSLSLRPVMRLRTEPPKEFYDEYLEVTNRRSSEERLARAYWECARLNVQGKYSFEKDLPDTPPPEFRIDDNLPADLGLKVDPASRLRYWARLRLVWALPQAWDKSYGWHTDWMRTGWLERRSRNFVGR